MLIQIILIFIIAFIVIRLVAKFRTGEMTMVGFCGWLAIWLAACGIIIWPDATVYVANVVGIGRGSDLVIYLSIIFLFYTIFRLTLRIEKMEKNLTKVVSEQAIKKYDSEK